MATGDSFRTVAGEQLGVRKAFAYLGRAMLLRCPVCGTKPIFLPVRRVRGLDDWFSPLDGCPRCGYAYEREPGYFLLAIFGFNLGFAVFVGIAVFTLLAASERGIANMPTWELLAKTVLPIPFLNLLIARHCKALFIALDHFVDPHVRETGDGDDDDDDGLNLLPAGPGGGSDGRKPDGDDDLPGPYDDTPKGTGARRPEPALTR